MADQPEGHGLSEVRRKYEGELLSLSGVVGVSEGKRGAEDAIQILVRRGVAVDLPDQLDGYPVVVIETEMPHAQ